MKWLAIGFVIAVSACAPLRMHTTPALLAALEPTAGIGTSIECDSGCTVQWQRAQLWLARHSVMKIQTATDVLLQTYNAHSFYEGFTVTKEPLTKQGSYRIKVEADCESIIGCAPTQDESTRALLYYAQTGTDVLEGKMPGTASLR
jgi:hypothetical protein